MSRINKNIKLNDKRKKFCEEYIIDLNATQAAIRAGYARKTARINASKMLSNVMCQNYIDSLRKNEAKKVRVSFDKIVKELKDIAFADIKDFLNNSDFSLKYLSEMKKSKCISEIQIHETTSKDGTKTQNIKFKLYDKQKAIDLLNKMLGFYAPEKIEQTGTIIVELPKDMEDDPIDRG